jgi:hypothetical protein
VERRSGLVRQRDLLLFRRHAKRVQFIICRLDIVLCDDRPTGGGGLSSPSEATQPAVVLACQASRVGGPATTNSAAGV